MKHFKILLFLGFLSSALVSQTFPVGHMSINFKDDTRTGGFAISGAVQMTGTGRDIGAEVYYPAVSAGTGVALASGQFPVVVFGHGFLMTYDNYDNIYNDLAARGYIVALPRTEGGITPNHLDFGKDLALLALQLQTLNTVSTPSALTIFNTKVLQKSAIGGHSMGGGCSFLGAENNTNLTCLFNMAAATSSTSGVSSIDAAALVTVPTLMLSGQRDCVADTSVQNSHYTSLASAKKFHVIFNDVTHCDFGNGSSVTCTLGQTTSGCSNTISNSLAFSRYMNFLVPFLNNQLKNSCPDGNQFMDSINANLASTTSRKIQGTLACSNIGIQSTLDEIAGTIYPNPTKDKFEINIANKGLDEKVFMSIFDQQGRSILLKEWMKSETTKTIDISEFEAGLYYVKIVVDKKQLMQKLIIE